MSTSSSSAAEDNFKKEICIMFLISFLSVLICFVLFYINHNENSQFILKNLDLKGSVEEGNSIFKIYCVGLHGIQARGLVGTDLHLITQLLNDKEIIKHVKRGLIPPLPSFEIDAQNMSNLLKYSYGLE